MIVRGGDCDGKYLKCYFLYYYIFFFNTGLFNNERLSKNFDNVYNDYISHNTISQISYHITKASHPSYYNHLIFFCPLQNKKTWVVFNFRTYSLSNSNICLNNHYIFLSLSLSLSPFLHLFYLSMNEWMKIYTEYQIFLLKVKSINTRVYKKKWFEHYKKWRQKILFLLKTLYLWFE